MDSFKRANISVNNVIVGKTWRHEFIKIGDTPHVSLSKKTIYCPPFGALNERENDLVMGFDIHENAHAAFTPSDPDSKWSKTFKTIMNYLEDLRVEELVGRKSIGCTPALLKMCRLVAGEISAGHASKMPNPFVDAMTSLFMESKGILFNVELSPSAKKIHSLIHDKFMEWRKSVNMPNQVGYEFLISLTKEIEDLLKSMSQDKPSGKKKPKEKNKPKDQEKPEKDDSDDSEPKDDKPDKPSKPKKDKEDESNDKEDESEGKDSDENEDGDEPSSDEDEEEKFERDEDLKDDPPDEGDLGEDPEQEPKDEDDKTDEPDEDDSEGDPKDDSQSSGEGGKADPNDDDPDEPDAEGKKLSITPEQIEKMCEDSLSNQLEKLISQVSKESAIRNENYTSFTENDRWNVPPQNAEAYVKHVSSVGSKVDEMSRFIERSLLSVQRSRKHPNRETGALDLSKLHLVSHGMSRKVFYKTTDGKELNTCVGLVVDESGSMGGKIRHTVPLVCVLSSCLDKVGIPFSVIGTTTKRIMDDAHPVFTRYNPIVYNLYKKFEEPLASVRNRFGSISCHDNNVDGEALETMARIMSNRRERRKVIISICDGEPCAGHGFSNDAEMGTNLINVCGRLRKNGFEVYSIGICTEHPKTYYGKNYFVPMNDVNTMGRDFFEAVYRMLVKGGLVR